MAWGVSGWCLKISKKIFLTFLGLGTNVVKDSSVNSELLFQLDTLSHLAWKSGFYKQDYSPAWYCLKEMVNTA